jgi:hypothetical protein
MLQNSAKATYIRNPTDQIAWMTRASQVALYSTRSHTVRSRIGQDLSWQRHLLPCMAVGQENPGGTQGKRLTTKCYLLVNSNKV